MPLRQLHFAPFQGAGGGFSPLVYIGPQEGVAFLFC